MGKKNTEHAGKSTPVFAESIRSGGFPTCEKPAADPPLCMRSDARWSLSEPMGSFSFGKGWKVRVDAHLFLTIDPGLLGKLGRHAGNPVRLKRMSITSDGRIHFTLGKCRYPGDKNHKVLDPLEFLARLP